MRTIAQEVGKAFVVFETNFGDVIKETKTMVRETKKAQSDMQKDISKTTKMMKQMGKVAKATGVALREAFQIGFGAAKLFAGALKIAFRVMKMGFSIIKGFIRLIGKGIAGAVKIAIRAVRTFGKVMLTVFKTATKALISLVRLPHTIGKALDELTKKFVFLQLDIRYIIDQFKRVFLTVGAITSGASAMLAVYEDAFVKVRKVVDMTDESLEALSSNIETLSTRVVTSAKALTELTAVGGQLGIEGVENLTRFTDVMAKLQMTTNIAGEEGAAQFSRLMNIMGVSQKYMKNMGSTMVALGNNFAAFENEILAMSFKLAGAGKAVGLTTQEVLALSTALSAAGVRAERGGSAVSRLMLEMANAAFSGGERLEEFSKIVGITAQQMEEMIKNNPIVAIKEFIRGLQRIDKAGGNVFEALEKVNVSQIRTRDVILRLVAAQNLLGETVEEANRAWEENIALEEEVAKRNETVWAQLQMLRDQALKFARAVGRLYEEQLKGFVGMLRLLVEVLNNLDQEQLNTIKDILTLIALVSGAITAVTMLVKAFFTFMTGVTLVGRFVVFMLPIIGALLVLKNLLAEFDMTPLEGVQQAFKTLWNLIKETKDALVDLYGWWMETDLKADLSENIKDYIDSIQNIQDKNVSVGLKFVWNIDETVKMITKNLHSIREAINRTIERIKTGEGGFSELNASEVITAELKVMQGRDLSTRETAHFMSESLYGLGQSIAEMIKEGMKLVFIDLPRLLYTYFKDSDDLKSLRDLITDTLTEGWENFKEKGKKGELKIQVWSQETAVPAWLAIAKKVTDNLNSFSEEGFTLDLGQGWKDFKAWMDDFTSGFFKDEEQKQKFKQSITDLWNALKDTLLQLFGDAITSVLNAIDWQSIFMDMMSGLWAAFWSVWGNNPDPGSNSTLYRGLMGSYSDQDRYTGNMGFEQTLTLDRFMQILKSGAALGWSDVKSWFEFSDGTVLSGYGGGDQIPALLERGEAVVPKEAVRGGLGGVAKWFKSMGVQGFQGGGVWKGSIGSDIANLTGFSREFIEGVQDVMEGSIDKLFDLLDQYVNKFVNILIQIVRGVGDFLKIFVGEQLHDDIDEAVEKVVGWLEKIVAKQEKQNEITEAERRRRIGLEVLEGYKPMFSGAGGNAMPWGDTIEIAFKRLEDKVVDLIKKVVAFSNDVGTHLNSLFDISEMIYGSLNQNLEVLRSQINAIQQIPELATKWEDAITGLKDGLSKYMNNNLASVLTPMIAGYMGAQSPTGTNIVGGFTSFAHAAGMITNPIIPVVAQLIGSFMPHEQISGEYKQLRNQVDSTNKALDDFGHSFDVHTPTVKDTTSWFERLFGGRDYTYYGMNKAEAELKVAQEILQQLNQILSQVASNIGNAFSAENTETFVTNLKESLWGTIRNAIISAFMQSALMQELMKPLTRMIQEFTADWDLTDKEQQKLREQINKIAEAAEPFYKNLLEMTDSVEETKQEMDTLNDALYNVPTGFKIAQARFDAASAITVAEGGSGHTIVIQGDIYGYEDFKEKVLLAQREGDMDLTISRYGT